MQTLLIINIAPWREAEMLEELAVLCRDIGATDVGFLVKAHPEMPPYLDKIHAAVARFARLKARLAPEGVQCGILLQQTIGHLERGFPVSPAPFQRIVGADGQLCAA
ncbi:MAG TPA: hypothetical protein PLZ36_08855, partial [Armatimonadota bacterium]|nr:hypothetical protein [Armatimonadota bacterium]